MHTERLTELWKLLDSVPTSQLHHRYWYEHSTRKRCLGGHCTQHPPFRADKLFETGEDKQPEFHGATGRMALAGFFGLTLDQVHHIFDPISNDPPDLKAAYAERLASIFPRPVQQPKEIAMSAVTIIEPPVASDMPVSEMPEGSYGVITRGMNSIHIGMVIHKVRKDHAYSITNTHVGIPVIIKDGVLASYLVRLLPKGTQLSFTI